MKIFFVFYNFIYLVTFHFVNMVYRYRTVLYIKNLSADYIYNTYNLFTRLKVLKNIGFVQNAFQVLNVLPNCR